MTSIDYANLKDTNRNLNQQWEDAAKAMAKRDLALQNTQETNTLLRHQIVGTKSEVKILQDEVNVAQKGRQDFELESGGYLKLLNEANRRISFLEEENRAVKLMNEKFKMHSSIDAQEISAKNSQVKVNYFLIHIKSRKLKRKSI